MDVFVRKNLEYAIINCPRPKLSLYARSYHCKNPTLTLFFHSQPLSAEDKSELQSTLKLFAKKGENILLTTKVDPALIGGMIVSIGDKYVDMSVASKIKKYTDLLQTPA